MSRNTVNFCIDSATMLVVLGLVATGLLTRFVLPPHSGSLSLWGWTRHDWGNLHFWLAAAGGALLIVHLALHWQWVCVTACRFVPQRTNAAAAHPVWRNVIGITALAGIIAMAWGMVILAKSSVDRTTQRRIQQVTAASVVPSEKTDREPGRPDPNDRRQRRGGRN